MQTRTLGRSDIEIAPLVFGGNVFGWTVDEAQSFELLDRFVERGFNAIDTADVYSDWAPGNEGGESETVIGNWLAKRGRRDDVVLMSKVGMWSRRKGLSANNIAAAVEDSLRRLRTEYLDVYFAHIDDSEVPLEETLQALSRLVDEGKVRAIGASNLQNWRFLALESKQAKERLKAVAYRQQKIVEASVVFVVCGVLSAHEQFAQILQPSVEQGIMEQALADRWVAQIEAIHSDNPTMQRDEAIRSGSLAAMTLMLSAQGMGLASCPMVGFDPKGVAKEFGLKDNEVPVMLVAVGYAAEGNWPQKPRRPLDEVLEII